MRNRILVGSIGLLLGILGGTALVAAPQPITNAPSALHNVFQLTPRVLSGSQPEGEAAFAWLAAQGVRTIVSVDGARPDVDAARRHGLRYVHLPVGYDGVPTNRVAELARLATTLPGPFYVHCHHGKHRGPTAAAVLCQASADWSVAEAEAFLKQAGTSPDYPGLYRSVQEYRVPDTKTLATLTNIFPEIAASGGLVPTMVAMDAMVDRLRACQQAGWRAPAALPDVSPAHEALQLWEQLRELPRSEWVKPKPAAFGELLTASERAAEELHGQLHETQTASGGTAELDARFRRVSETCSACHARFRN